MYIKFDGKLIKTIKIIAISLTVLAIISMGISVYQTNKFMKEFDNTSVSDETDITIIEWLADYENDIALQEQWKRDFEETKIRLEKLGVEFDEQGEK